eukprot:gene20950-biopygen11634
MTAPLRCGPVFTGARKKKVQAFPLPPALPLEMQRLNSAPRFCE